MFTSCVRACVLQSMNVMDVNVRQVLDMVTQQAQAGMTMNASVIGASVGMALLVEAAAYTTRLVCCIHIIIIIFFSCFFL